MRNLKYPAPASSANAPSHRATSASSQTDSRGLRPVREYVQDYFQKYLPGLNVRPFPKKTRKARLMTTVRSLALVGCLLIPAVQAADVAPLGFPVGKATKSQVETSLRGKVVLKTLGTNKYSLGPMLSAPGHGFELEGLNEALFVFDRNETLVAVRMQFEKGFMGDRFRKLYAYLRQKYPVTDQSIPHVGDSWARFRQGNVAIKIDAPHMNFTVTVLYMTQDFEKRFRDALREERQNRKQREVNQF